MKNSVLAVLALIGLASPSAAADITGSWEFQGVVENVTVNMKCSFKQDAGKVAGSCMFEQFGAAETPGEVSGDTVTLRNHAVRDGQGYDLTWKATLDSTGAAMKGNIDVPPYAGTFTSKKVDEPPAAGITGNWTISGEVVGNNILMKCALKQEAAKVSGNCNYQGLGDSQTTGTVSENKLTLQNSVTRDQQFDLTYTGTLDSGGASVKGDIAVAGVAGTFSGTKDK